MQILKKVLAVITLIFLLVMPHELGHLIAAKVTGVGAIQLSVGFGKPLGCVWAGETRVCLASIPLGGYVELVDSFTARTMSKEEVRRLLTERPEVLRMVTDPARWRSSASPLTQFFIGAAGVPLNFLLALALVPLLRRWGDEGRLSLSQFDLDDNSSPQRKWIGPIGIFKLAARAGEQGLPSICAVVARFSVALGVMQLLPIPFLDGSHLLHAFLEALGSSDIAGLTGMAFILLLLRQIYLVTVFRLGRVRSRILLRSTDRFDRLRQLLSSWFSSP